MSSDRSKYSLKLLTLFKRLGVRKGTAGGRGVAVGVGARTGGVVLPHFVRCERAGVRDGAPPPTAPAPRRPGAGTGQRCLLS